MLPRLALTFTVATMLSLAPAVAQTSRPVEPPVEAPAAFDAPAYVAVVDGGATLERDGRIETAPLNMPLLGGDTLRTTDGRLEVRFADGGRLRLDSHTSVDVLSDDLVRLTGGRLRLSVVRAGSQQVTYRVDSPAGSVRIFQPGEYRLALLRGAATSPGVQGEETQLEFAVITGGGEIATEQGATAVRAGERAYASAGLLPSYASAYNSAAADDFDQWARMQRETVYTAASQSAQYLPQDMTSYASTFDQYGDWRYQQEYGYVWYPRVAADWHPYYYGRWSSYPTYGWTWITADRFGYPTHHYGRWGFSAGLWFWIPSSAWGPAYVSWAYAPDYVSWCPLGWNNYAVFSIGYYNVGAAYYSSHYRGRYYNAWTTVPHGYFGRGYAHQHAVNFDRGYNGARPHFNEGRTPARPSYVSARTNVAPIRNAGTRSASAGIGQSPRYINRGNEIVRSQTARPIAPRPSTPRDPQGGAVARDNAIARSAPPYASGAYGRQPRAWDNPSYRPPAYNPSYSAPQQRTAPQMRGYDQAVPRQGGAYQRPPSEYPRPGGAYAQPGGAYAQPGGAYAQPGGAYAQPGGAYAQPRGGNAQPGVYGRPGGAYPRPDGGYARPAPSPGSGERAVPRSEGRPAGGGHVETRAPSGAGVHSRGGRSR